MRPTLSENKIRFKDIQKMRAQLRVSTNFSTVPRISEYNILAESQHCFRSGRSCETQLVQFIHDLCENLDGAHNRGHKQTDLIIMDFAKAFDSVSHRINIRNEIL